MFLLISIFSRNFKNALYDTILVHDGARPFISKSDIKKIIEDESKLSFLGSKMVDSVKNKEMVNLNRNDFILTYTPQKVSKDLYLEAYSKTNNTYTDDVTLIQEELGIIPSMVEGRRDNTKITTNEDYMFALERVERYRIGHSWDTHKLVYDRRLII